MKDLEQNTSFGSNNGTVKLEWVPAKARSVALNRPGRSGPLKSWALSDFTSKTFSSWTRISEVEKNSSGRDTDQSAVRRCRMVNSI